MSNIFLEKTLEDIVYDNAHTVHLKGLPIFYKMVDRQFLLPSGKKIDLLTWEITDADTIHFKIIELKKEEITESAYWQALEYYSEFLECIIGHFKHFNAEVILIGTDKGRKPSLAVNISNNVSIFTYHFTYDGIRFVEYKASYNKLKEYALSMDPEDGNIKVVTQLRTTGKNLDPLVL